VGGKGCWGGMRMQTEDAFGDLAMNGQKSKSRLDRVRTMLGFLTPDSLQRLMMDQLHVRQCRIQHPEKRIRHSRMTRSRRASASLDLRG
jgi:hypothetical protein